MATSENRKFRREMDKYFEKIKHLDIGKEYLSICLKESKLPKKTQTVLMDYVRLRCRVDKEFSIFIEHLGKIIQVNINKVVNNESTDNSGHSR